MRVDPRHGVVRDGSTRDRAGLTIVELILALGLFALVATAITQLITTTLDIWEEAEVNREQLAREAGLTEWFRRDLEFLAAGEYGDLLCDWELFDVDGDGIATRPAPRLRLVRRATAEDLRRLGQRRPIDSSGEVALPPAGARPLVEVAWLLMPPAFGPKEVPRGGAVLLRGERLLDEPGSYFDRGAIGGDGMLRVGSAEPIATEVLHWRVLFASQTSSLASGWRVGTGIANVSSAWDARDLGRPNVERHPLNQIAAGSPAYLDAALLPRRVRIEFELQRPADAERRPRLSKALPADERTFLVVGSRDLPKEGSYALLGEEWVRVTTVAGERITVQRGERGTRPLAQKAGTPLEWGDPVAREIVIPQHAEDWGL